VPFGFLDREGERILDAGWADWVEGLLAKAEAGEEEGEARAL